ncbi:MAG: geranylgeranylglycerol-phosphate geranylgeranyltransferase [Ferruginibacter sp.]
MKLVTAFLRLIRWPNLVFIVVTQLLFCYGIASSLITPPSNDSLLRHNLQYLVLLSLSSVLIAAAGYIINDYFDLNIDRVNKPDKLVVEKLIKRRWAIIWHWGLSLAGILIGFYIAVKQGKWTIAFANTGCVVLLWFYSTTFKKKLLIGNIIISLLTAWVILVFFIYLAGFVSLIKFGPVVIYQFDVSRLFKLSVLYAGFAFIISLVREVVKDMEDMEGDAKYGCRTMPIVWGVPASKVFVAVWIVVLTGALVVIQFYALHLHWWWSVLYCVITIIAPLLWLLRQLYRAQQPKDYHRLSTVVKLVMLAGILSMLFFRLYAG